MSRFARARGYAQGRIFGIGDPVPDTVGKASWIAESAAAIDEPDTAVVIDNLTTRTAKALREIAKAEKVKVETDDNKADLIRKIRAARAEAAPAEKE